MGYSKWWFQKTKRRLKRNIRINMHILMQPQPMVVKDLNNGDIKVMPSHSDESTVSIHPFVYT